MGIDIKLPIGIMFSVFGVLLTCYGVLTNSNAAMYQKSFGLNINVYSGLFMLVFGAVMLLLAWKTYKSVNKK
jgi:hypothetical protein